MRVGLGRSSGSSQRSDMVEEVSDLSDTLREPAVLSLRVSWSAIGSHCAERLPHSGNHTFTCCY